MNPPYEAEGVVEYTVDSTEIGIAKPIYSSVGLVGEI